MKKWISLLLTLSILIGSLSVVGSLMPATAASVPGDVNGDGNVATYDARMLLAALVGGTELTATQKTAADYDRDGKINTSDVKKILRAAMSADLGSLSTVSLLAPDMDLWNNPIQLVQNTYCTVKQTSAAQGVALVNVTEQDECPGYTGYNAFANPYTWPYTSHAYDRRILIPADATITFDVTVASSAASINLYLGGARPDVDPEQTSKFVQLNKFMTSNVDANSGDMNPGTYTGSVKVSTILNSTPNIDDCMFNGNLWVSGIKVYVVGYNDDAVTIRTLSVDKAYQTSRDFNISADPYQAIKSDYVFTSETAGLQTLTGLEVYQNGERTPKTSFDYSADNKKIYYTENKKRIMNYPDGYQIDMPLDWNPDFSLSALRTQYESDECVLTISKEEENPYSSWETYRDEWLIPYISNQNFLDANLMRYTRDPIVSETMLSGYTVMTYDIAIDWQGKIAMPYYSIAIIRKYYTYDTFYLLVLKSSVPTEGMIDRLIRSFKEITVYGTPVNVQGQYERIIPENWNAETRAYYEKLCNQNSTDWGFFSHSMVEPADSSFGNRYDFIIADQERISNAIDYTPDIIPTYTHLGWGNYLIPFPSEMAEDMAGGNGFNGKPVLQYTYQFTTTNNTNLAGMTPIYNVLRGDYDDHFRELAQAIKDYGKPVLFRLNNEMNTDWTSYCGLVSLLDPDIFVLGWQYLYEIFEEEGVDNCIWIFNPFTPTTPYSSWGETLCYMPGPEYVQMLGLTNYEMGNSSSTYSSFYSEYTTVYNDNKNYFMNMPWIISEFAAGAGGEKSYNYTYDYWQNTTLGRNAAYQTQYVTYMFYYLNNRASYPFCQNIKAAVWFNRSDYVQIDGVDYIVNYLELTSGALNAFKSGLAGR